MAISVSLAAFLLLLVAAVTPSAYALEEDSVVSAVFLKDDLDPGSKMTLHFTRATAPMLPRGRADSIPFSSAKIPEILSLLSVPTDSPAAADIRLTLAQCEAPPTAGVTAQRCVTSFESMVDFAASSLGTRDVRAMTTKLISKQDGATPRQAYMVEAVRPIPAAGQGKVKVACHRVPYPYAVFACHTTTAALYKAILAGADGTMAEPLVACHLDASPGSFDEKIVLAPGSAPVCHFLPQDSMLWVRNN